jgi:cobalt-zinc-cadmium efflux system protein
MAEVHAEHPEGMRPHARVLIIGLVLTLSYAFVQLVASVLSGSLALASDAVHMFADSAGLLLALTAAQVALRPPNFNASFGYARVEVLVVPLHVLFMIGIAGYIVYEGVGRVGESPEISGLPVLITALIGLGINVFVLRTLGGHAHDNLNVRGAMYEVMADTLGSVGVIASAVVILTLGWTPIDVIISFAIAALVVPRAIMLLRHSLLVLLEATPAGIDAEAIERDAQKVPGVLALHDLHVWTLAPTFVSCSAHVEVETMQDCDRQLLELTTMLRERYDIHHVTLQPETHDLHEAIACCESPDRQEVVAHVHHESH